MPETLHQPAMHPVVAVWTTPRLGLMATFDCIYHALPPFRIPVVRAMGAFWGQGMTNAMLRALAEFHPEWLLALDYDSLFGPEEVQALLGLAAMHPEADAICPFQWHRCDAHPLFTPLPGADGKLPAVSRSDLCCDLYPIASGHFGLTLLRGAAVQRLPHPWFLPVPDGDGLWSDSRTDDDVHFWNVFRASGARAFLAPRIAIGHVQECAVWPGDALRPTWQNLSDWHKGGRPAGVFSGH